MIAPIKKTHAVSGSSSQVSAKPLRVCEARRGAGAVDLCVVEGAGDVDGEVGAVVLGVGVVVVGVGAVAVRVGAVAVRVGAVAVGVSGNC
jgi:hypothetical protein